MTVRVNSGVPVDLQILFSQLRLDLGHKFVFCHMAQIQLFQSLIKVRHLGGSLLSLAGKLYFIPSLTADLLSLFFRNGKTTRLYGANLSCP